MKVKLLVCRGGPNFTQNAGEVVDVGDAEGHRMIVAEQAIACDADGVEAAVITGYNHAAKRVGPLRGRTIRKRTAVAT